MHIKKETIISFLLGAILMGISQWLLVFRKPLIISDQAKGNYAYGQQLARNLLKQKIKLDPQIIAASMMDAQNNSSRLSDEEMRKGLDVIQNEAMALRKAEYVAPAPEIPKKESDAEYADGFLLHPVGFRYWVGDWKSYEHETKRVKGQERVLEKNNETRKNKKALPRSQDPSQNFEFQLVIRDQRERIIFNSVEKKKNFKFNFSELPPALAVALDSLRPTESMLIRTASVPNLKLKFSWPRPVDETTTVEILRLK